MNTIVLCGIYWLHKKRKLTQKNKRRLRTGLQVLLIIYGVVGISIYYLQDKIIFHPVKLETNYKFNFPGKTEEMTIALNSDDSINLVKFFPVKFPSKGVVLYFHGNRQNVERYAKFTEVFLRNGYEVWVPDYPGYGKSRGALTEINLYKTGWAVRKLAAVSFSNDCVIIYGKSLGSAVAAYTATGMPAKELILETPYYSMRQVFRSYGWMYPVSRLVKYELPTYKYIDGLKMPIVIFHGTNDGVIRYSDAYMLKPYLKLGDEFITIPGGSHNTVNLSPIYFKKMDSLLR